VLGAIVRHAALVEAFHQTPSVGEILKCVGKQLSMHAELRREDNHAPLPLLWILSSGRPHTAMRQLGLSRMRRAARGVYTAPLGFGLRVVVVSELSRTRGSLILRLLGTGRTFRDALQELEKLPTTAWEVRTAAPGLVRYRLVIGGLVTSERTAEEEAIMAAQNMYDAWEREHEARGEARGKALGLDEGLAPLVRQFQRRLGRELTESERATLRERLDTVGPDRLGDVVLDLSEQELADWLADPAAR
jgi:hypothetical protein